MDVEIEDKELHRSRQFAWIAIISGVIGLLVVLLNTVFGPAVNGTSVAMSNWGLSGAGKSAEGFRQSVGRPSEPKKDAARQDTSAREHAREQGQPAPVPSPERPETSVTSPRIELGAIPSVKGSGWDEPGQAAQNVTIPSSNGEFEKVCNELLATKPAEFRPGGAILTWNGKSNLDLLLTYLKGRPELKFELGVHVAPGEGPLTDDTLSLARAEAIAGYLGSEGISAARMVLKGYGSSKPIADNSVEVGRVKNQRVEIRVLGTL